MPKVSPDILIWARETAHLDLEHAAKKLQIQDSAKSSASEKLALYGKGIKRAV